MDIKYTIIIPHYNIPKLLDRLLHSIPVRKDIQVIVVDDCSDAEVLSNLSRLQKLYYNVEFYSTSINAGGGRARNIGLMYARGEYVIFADADDYFTPQFSEILNTYQDSSDYDVIYFNNISVDSETLKPSNRNSQLASFFKLASRDPEKGWLAFRFIFGEPWCKIIRRRIVEENRISFEETPIHNDTRFSYLVGFYGKNIKLDERVGYCITSRLNSVSKQISDDNLVIRTRIFSEKRNFLRNNSIPLVDPMVFTPMSKAIKSHNFTLVKRILRELKRSGYNKMAYLRDYYRFRKEGTIDE